MKRRLTGTVVSDMPDQTVVVAIERRVNHPVYRKAYTITKKVHAHDPENQRKTGDIVVIEEIPPKSALKRWQVVEADVEGVKQVKEKTRAAKSQRQLENEAKAEAEEAAEPKAEEADEKKAEESK